MFNLINYVVKRKDIDEAIAAFMFESDAKRYIERELKSYSGKKDYEIIDIRAKGIK